MGEPDMREPRPVWLTDQERHALRLIEEALTSDDPRWAGRMDGSGTSRPRFLGLRMSRALVVIVRILLVVALLVLEVILQTGGALLLLVIPAIVWRYAMRTTVIDGPRSSSAGEAGPGLPEP
jgi:hypothetical protein